MSATADQVKQLREETGAGVLECKKALDEAGGDMAKAANILQERGLAKAEKRAGRETSAGVLDLYSHGEGRVGVMIEVNCETDFVARTDEFRGFAHEMALQVAASAPQWVAVADVPQDVVEEQGAEIRKQAEAEDKPADVIDRIVEGRLGKFFQEACLLEQPYIRDDERSVAEILKEMIATTGENITIRRFVRWSVGDEQS
ncbi:MAG: translation elongation factor Ts [Anaerolineales bacterium]|jgi:elongation factor Ts